MLSQVLHTAQFLEVPIREARYLIALSQILYPRISKKRRCHPAPKRILPPLLREWPLGAVAGSDNAGKPKRRFYYFLLLDAWYCGTLCSMGILDLNTLRSRLSRSDLECPYCK